MSHLFYRYHYQPSSPSNFYQNYSKVQLTQTQTRNAMVGIVLSLCVPGIFLNSPGGRKQGNCVEFSVVWLPFRLSSHHQPPGDGLLVKSYIRSV